MTTTKCPYFKITERSKESVNNIRRKLEKLTPKNEIDKRLEEVLNIGTCEYAKVPTQCQKKLIPTRDYYLCFYLKLYIEKKEVENILL